jgi:hypothetical protein
VASTSELVEIGHKARTSMLRDQTPVSYLAKLVQRTEQSAREAREFNKTILPDHQENFYLAGMNLVAKTFWELAKNPKSDPHELKLYFDMMKDHFELKIKTKKNDLASRHLKLLEAKSKALAELAKDTSLTDMQVAGRVREIFCVEKTVTNGNGHQNGQPQRLIENGLAS